MPNRYGENEREPRYPQADPDIARILDYRTIDACDLCDTHGNRGMHLCDHVDWASAAARGMAMIRTAMGWDRPTSTHRHETPSGDGTGTA